jgi:peptide/nickel transport system permease protein
LRRLLVGRAVQSIGVLFALSLLLFGLRQVMGDPVVVLLPPHASQEEIEVLRQFYGLDKPLYEQYAIWLSKVVRGQMGNSLRTGEPAMQMFLDRLPASALLSGVSIVFGLVVAICLGVTAAVYRGTAVDAIVRAIAALGQSVPLFWIGIVSINLFAVRLGLLPVAGLKEPLSVILPSLTLSTFSIAAMTRLLRSSMLDVLDTEYIKMARAKGLSEAVVILKHALRNAIIALITFASLFFAINIGFVVVIERVFAWPGVGSLALGAAIARDYPVLQASVLLLALIILAVNILVDLSYGVLDPRIRVN